MVRLVAAFKMITNALKGSKTNTTEVEALKTANI